MLEKRSEQQDTAEARAQAMLECLREAVAEAIETKRKLGQYWVVNTPDGPKFEGPGAPVA
jgi:hypothetical protein